MEDRNFKEARELVSLIIPFKEVPYSELKAGGFTWRRQDLYKALASALAKRSEEVPTLTRTNSDGTSESHPMDRVVKLQEIKIKELEAEVERLDFLNKHYAKCLLETKGGRNAND